MGLYRWYNSSTIIGPELLFKTLERLDKIPKIGSGFHRNGPSLMFSSSRKSRGNNDSGALIRGRCKQFTPYLQMDM